MQPLAVILLALALLLDATEVLAQRTGARVGARSSGGVWGTPGWAGAPRFFHGSRIFIPPAAPIWPVFGGINVYPGFSGYQFPLAWRGYPRFYRSSNWYWGGYPGSVDIDVSDYSPGAPVPWEPPAGPGYPDQYAPAPAQSRVRNAGQLAPYDPMPAEVVERMLMLAAVTKDDVVYDLGAGDGRVVIAAAKKYGVKAVGFEIDPGLVKLARENVRKQGLEKRVEIRQQDFTGADLSRATVVTLYLSYDGNQVLRPQLVKQLKPGSRVVSYTFDMGDWPAKITESYRDGGGDLHMLYLWQITAPAVYGENQRDPTAP
jgi:protein-L-isoaspartate O-methyltransferase